MGDPARREEVEALVAGAMPRRSDKTEVDHPMREYIRDMLAGLSDMASQARLHDLSGLLRVAMREAARHDGHAVDVAAVKAALKD